MEPADPPLFADLDATGRFCRDTAVGRVFHPGATSYREISEVDSLHVAVYPDNRITVHVDRVSPLHGHDGGRLLYSVPRALAHNVVHLLEAVGRLVHRRCGQHRCELRCEVVWVDDDADVDEARADGVVGIEEPPTTASQGEMPDLVA